MSSSDKRGQDYNPGFQEAKFDHFKDLLEGIPWVRALVGRVAQEIWLI